MASEEQDRFKRLLADMDRQDFYYGSQQWPSAPPEYQQMGNSNPYMEQGGTFAADADTLEQWFPSTGYTGEMNPLPTSAESEDFLQCFDFSGTEPAEKVTLPVESEDFLQCFDFSGTEPEKVTLPVESEDFLQCFDFSGTEPEKVTLPVESEDFLQGFDFSAIEPEKVTLPVEFQQTGINVPQYMGQGNMSAPNTLQQGNFFPNVYMGQDATLAALSLPGQTQATNQAKLPTPPTIGDVSPDLYMGQEATLAALPLPDQTQTTIESDAPTPPVTPPIKPTQRKERAPRGGVTNPREYRRSLKSCERCMKNKIKCDDHPEGCQRCKKAGEECWVVDPPIKGRLQRAEANALLDQMEALYTWSKALEAKCQAYGVELPEKPEGLPTPENASWLAEGSTMN